MGTAHMPKTIAIVAGTVLIAGVAAAGFGASVPGSRTPEGKPESRAVSSGESHSHGPCGTHTHGRGAHVHPNGAHSCSLTTPAGLAQALDGAVLTVVGHAGPAEEWDGGLVRIRFDIGEVISAAPGHVPVTVAGADGNALWLLADGHDLTHAPLPEDAHVMLFLRPVTGISMGGAYSMDRKAYTFPADANGVVWVDEPECEGMLDAARTLGRTMEFRLDPESIAARASALAGLVVSGGAIARQRAAIDFRQNQPLIDALDAAQVRGIAAVLDGLDLLDPALSDLMVLLASRGDPGLVPHMISPLGRDRGDRAMESAARVLGTDALRDAAALELGDRLAAGNDPAVRRRLAFVLARIGGERARGVLQGLLRDADRDVVAEAMIGLAGSGNDAARSLAYDWLRPVIMNSLAADSMDPVDVRLRSRELQDVRTGWHAGERLHVLAAGYFLARSPQAEDGEWLRARLDRIASFAVREFFRSRLDHPWMHYDTPW